MRNFELQDLAQDWNHMFLKLIEDKKTNPINQYQPTRPYSAPAKTSKVKLNVAAGPNVFPHDGWINLDKYDFSQYFNFIKSVNTDNGMPEHQKKLWQFVQDGGQVDFQQQDMLKPFAIDDASVDFVYVGQAIEHLNYIHQAPVFLQEMLRVLKPGGILRMSTPDFTKLINAYNANDMMKFADDQPAFYKDLDASAQLMLLMYGASGPDCTQEKYEGHFFCFTEHSMQDLLLKVGFKDISFTYPGHGKDKEIAMEIRDEGFSHSMIVEAVK